MLQAAHSNHQIGAFENFDELVEDMLIVLRPRPKVFFQYELRFVNRLKSQLLISHLFFPSKEMPSKEMPSKETPSDREKEARNQAAFWEMSPLFLDCSINFYFNVEAQRPIAALPGSTLLPKFLWHLRMAAAPGWTRPGVEALDLGRTHWLMPNVGTLAKDGNSYVFAAKGQSCERVAFVSTKGARRAC
ncbi:hypothetical protein [Bradyrhizobium sp. AZCC 1693]|uniref:hypothetical protein n=1 Tax=Bradyrhizobium sp. AZCC 1693 TaxID=3117029 RepID=UPI002FEF6CB8